MDDILVDIMTCTSIYHMQVYTGSYQSNRHGVKCVNDLSGLEVGHNVAIHVEDCELEPAIAVILQISGDTIRVKWFQGTYTSAWKPWMLREGRKKVYWEDNIPKNSVILFDFSLGKNGHLRKSTTAHLKELYESIRQHDTVH